MSAYYSGFLVTLKDDIKDEYVGRVVELLRLIDGVIKVEPVAHEPLAELIVTNRLKYELREKILKVVD